MTWRWDQADPFGSTAPNGNPAGLGNVTYNPRFPGQVFDAENNLNYHYARNYDSTLGRYVQSDPIGLGGGIGTYTYVGSQPLVSQDRFGLCPPPPDCKKVAAKCREQCSETHLPTTDYGFQFFNCVNDCLLINGCGPDQRPLPTPDPSPSPSPSLSPSPNPTNTPPGTISTLATMAVIAVLYLIFGN
jgi:RHS repeat-associated protein